MNFIEKHSKLLAVALCLCASGPVLSTVHAYETQPGWHGEDADRYYVLESNRQRATGLTEIDGDVYYFNGQGEMQFDGKMFPIKRIISEKTALQKLEKRRFKELHIISVRKVH